MIPTLKDSLLERTWRRLAEQAVWTQRSTWWGGGKKALSRGCGNYQQDVKRSGLPIQTQAVGEVGHGEGVARAGRLLGLGWACDSDV